MSEQCPSDCLAGQLCELQPNPDIGGTGVLVGFLGTAWFVVLLVVLYYFFAHDPSKSPYWSPGDLETNNDSTVPPNAIDEFVLGSCRKAGHWFLNKSSSEENHSRVSSWLSRREQWENAFRTAILSMCDIQMLTGLGILLSGYIGLLSYISAYHWQLVVYLAWLSNLTHVACLTVLRGYLHHHEAERVTRMTFMTILWLSLFPAMIPTIFFNWSADEPTAANPASSARCFFNHTMGQNLYNRNLSAIRGANADPGNKHFRNPVSFEISTARESAILSIILLFFGYFTRSIKLVKSFSQRVHANVREHTSRRFLASLRRTLEDASEPQTGPKSLSSLVRWDRLKIVAYLVGKHYTDLLTSEISDVFWLILSAAWATQRIVQERSSVTVKDYDWGFGQILPVFLLLGPIVMIVQAVLTPEGKQDTRHGETATNSPGRMCSAARQSRIPASDPSHSRSQPTPPLISESHRTGIPMEPIPPVFRHSRESPRPSRHRTSSGTFNRREDATLDGTENIRHISAPEPAETASTRGTSERNETGIKDALNEWYKNPRHMMITVSLTFSQVIVITVSFFLDRSSTRITVLSYMSFYALLILFSQPLNCYLLVLFQLSIQKGRPGLEVLQPASRAAERVAAFLSVGLIVNFTVTTFGSVIIGVDIAVSSGITFFAFFLLRFWSESNTRQRAVL